MSALTDAIYQNTAGNSQGQPLGLSWDTGKSVPDSQRPPGGRLLQHGQWFIRRPELRSARITPATLCKYRATRPTLLLTNGTWVELQNQATSGVAGDSYVADFSSNASIPFKTDQKNSDGSVTLNAPPAGYNDHFCPSAPRNFLGRIGRGRLRRGADEDQRS